MILRHAIDTVVEFPRKTYRYILFISFQIKKSYASFLGRQHPLQPQLMVQCESRHDSSLHITWRQNIGISRWILGNLSKVEKGKFWELFWHKTVRLAGVCEGCKSFKSHENNNSETFVSAKKLPCL